MRTGTFTARSCAPSDMIPRACLGVDVHPNEIGGRPDALVRMLRNGDKGVAAHGQSWLGVAGQWQRNVDAHQSRLEVDQRQVAPTLEDVAIRLGPATAGESLPPLSQVRNDLEENSRLNENSLPMVTGNCPW